MGRAVCWVDWIHSFFSWIWRCICCCVTTRVLEVRRHAGNDDGKAGSACSFVDDAGRRVIFCWLL